MKAVLILLAAREIQLNESRMRERGKAASLPEVKCADPEDSTALN
jgi:hypothetical protein